MLGGGRVDLAKERSLSNRWFTEFPLMQPRQGRQRRPDHAHGLMRDPPLPMPTLAPNRATDEGALLH